jgi:hypothetical protein
VTIYEAEKLVRETHPSYTVAEFRFLEEGRQAIKKLSGVRELVGRLEKAGRHAEANEIRNAMGELF